MIDLAEVLTFSEAAEKWGFSDGNTLRKAVERQKFKPYEIRKSGNVWLTTYEAMARVFGSPENVNYTIAYADIIEIARRCIKEHADFKHEIRDIYLGAVHALNEEGQIAVIESNRHPNVIARIITSSEDLDSWLQYFEYRLSKSKK